MEAETVLNLLDSYWYNLDFFNRSKSTSKNTVQETPSLATIQTIEKQSSSSLISDSASPNSVLIFNSKLQTIFSGKNSKDFEDSRPEKEPQLKTPIKGSPMKSRVSAIRRKQRGLSKSLSDLEFEELKGFMDLGFVFSEDDKDSSLASIIPGLHRLGKKSQANDDDGDDNENLGVVDDESEDKNSEKGENWVNRSEVSRPYLSEAWQVKEKKKRENSLFNGRRVPAFNSEIDMKDYLRLWAHTVASTVR